MTPAPIVNEDAICSPCEKRFYTVPSGCTLTGPSVEYFHCQPRKLSLDRIAQLTPKPKGHKVFSSFHVVHQEGELAKRLVHAPRVDGLGPPVHSYHMPKAQADPAVEEYNG